MLQMVDICVLRLCSCHQGACSVTPEALLMPTGVHAQKAPWGPPNPLAGVLRPPAFLFQFKNCIWGIKTGFLSLWARPRRVFVFKCYVLGLVGMPLAGFCLQILGLGGGIASNRLHLGPLRPIWDGNPSQQARALGQVNKGQEPVDQCPGSWD